SIWDFSEGLAKVKLNGKYGFIDKSGKIIAKPKFDYGEYFSEGLAGVKLNGRWGFMDKNGKIVIEPKFDDIGY
ncbi:WG repeat-containing protein, partial [Campylobacter coli]